MNKKLLILSTASIVLTTTIVGGGFKVKNFSLLTNASLAPSECLHEHVEHYDAVESTTEFGHLEYWCCCDCHASFDHDPTANDADVIPSTAGDPLDPTDGRSIYPLVGEFGLSYNHTLIENKDDVNTDRGFLRAYSITGTNGTYANGMNLPTVNLLKYDLLTFSLKVLNSKWVEPYKADAYGTTRYSGETNSSNYKLFGIQRRNPLSLTYDWLVDGSVKQTFTISQDAPFLSDYVKFRVAEKAEVVVSELRGIPNEYYSETVVANSFISGATYDSSTQQSTTTISGWHSKKAFAEVDISDYKEVFFYVNVESTNNIDICMESVGDISCVQGDNLVVLKKNAEGTWNVYLNSTIANPARSNYDLNGSTLGLNITANAKTNLIMSQLFGVLENNFDTTTRPMYKKIADSFFIADDTWTKESADYTNENNYTYDYPFAYRKKHETNVWYDCNDVDLTGIDSMVMYMNETGGTDPYIYFATAEESNVDFHAPAKQWTEILFERGEDTIWNITCNGTTKSIVTTTGNNINEIAVKLLNYRTYKFSPVFILDEMTPGFGGDSIANGTSVSDIYVPETIKFNSVSSITSNAFNVQYALANIENPYQYQRISFYFMGAASNNSNAFVQLPDDNGSANNHGVWNLVEFVNTGVGFDIYFQNKKRSTITDFENVTFKFNPGTYYFTSYCCE